MYCAPQLDSSIHTVELSPNSDLYNPFLPELSSPDVKLDCSMSNLSLKLRYETRNLFRCIFFLKAVRSFVSDVYYYFTESRGGPEGSGGNYIQVASICKSVGVLLVRLIL